MAGLCQSWDSPTTSDLNDAIWVVWAKGRRPWRWHGRLKGIARTAGKTWIMKRCAPPAKSGGTAFRSSRRRRPSARSARHSSPLRGPACTTALIPPLRRSVYITGTVRGMASPFLRNGRSQRAPSVPAATPEASPQSVQCRLAGGAFFSYSKLEVDQLVQLSFTLVTPSILCAPHHSQTLL